MADDLSRDSDAVGRCPPYGTPVTAEPRFLTAPHLTLLLVNEEHLRALFPGERISSLPQLLPRYMPSWPLAIRRLIAELSSSLGSSFGICRCVMSIIATPIRPALSLGWSRRTKPRSSCRWMSHGMSGRTPRWLWQRIAAPCTISRCHICNVL
jgi:hypothetical protein